MLYKKGYIEIKKRIISGNSYTHSIQKLQSCCFLFKTLKIKIHSNILPVMYGYECW